VALTLTSYGGALEVTGSKHVIEADGRRILLDCGMFQGRRAETYEKNRRLPLPPDDIDCAVLSHGPYDHCAKLPVLPKHGYEGNIVATPATRDISNLIMMDTAHIMAKDYEWLRKHEPEKYAYPPIYDERDVVRVLGHFITVGYNRRFPLCDGVTCEFYNSGHILGSALVVLSIRRGSSEFRVGFTGDLGRPGMPIIPDPTPMPPVDVLICEGTYGNRRHDPLTEAKRQLAEVIRDTVKRGGKVVIPAFAVGRTQELVYFLHLLKDEHEIPDIDVFVDSPMAVNATAIFRVHQECYNEDVHKAFLDHHQNPFGFSGLRYITDVEESKQLNNRTDPCIIISSSGMCEAGRILHHLKNNITDPRNTVLIVGFMAEHTLGRAIADRRPVVKIFGNPYPLKARVKILNTFSAHADMDDIRQYISAMDLKRLRRVYLVHGEPDALNHLAGVLEQVGVRAVTVVKPETTYDFEETT